MAALVSLPRIWELLKSFKEFCKNKGWKTSEDSDWIRLDHEFHDFVWARNVLPSTFIKLSKNPKCTIHEGSNYHVVNASYLAWLFQQTPSESFLRWMTEFPELYERTALYDLSPLYQGSPVCFKLNTTKSRIFKEFETFLAQNWGVTVKNRL